MLLSGPTLQLIPYAPEYWNYLAKWFYDGNYDRMFRHQPRALTQYDFEHYTQLIQGQPFMIIKQDTKEVIGLIQMIPDCKTNRAFYLGLLIDSQYQGARWPTEATAILGNYAFNRLGYRKMIIEIVSGDTNLSQTLIKTGFTKEGTLKEEVFMNGKFVDEDRYSMLADDFINIFKDEAMKGRATWVASLKQ